MMIKFNPILLSIIISIAVIARAHADDQSIKLLSLCQSCHGKTGDSLFPNIPNLAGQKEDYLIKQLTELKSGIRIEKTMSAVAKILTQKEIDSMALYFSRQKPKQ